MLFVSLRDLQWRRRRFFIGVLATGLVFALALLIAGISQSFVNEVSRTVKVFDVNQWVISEKATGPLTSSTLIGEQLVDTVRKSPGVTAAAPLLVARDTVHLPGAKDIGVMGVVPGSIGMPKVKKGRALQGSGEVIADSALGRKVGDTLTVGGLPLRVVGTTSGVSYFAGTPVVFASLDDVQKFMVAGQPLVTSILVRGHLDTAPPGTHAVDNAAVVKDLRRPLDQASGTVDILRTLLWLVAAGIIASILYVQAIERTRDFAVFKAMGVTGRSLASGLAFQAVLLALLSAVVAIFLSMLLKPLMPMRVEIPTSAVWLLVIASMVIGVLASLFGLRRAVSVDPALAFGGQ
ncbi:MAG TPA: FtsX-like permease family protein [Acidimicrobiia bacterium]|nr:FtsX-like permease family protein [Acidimicrobiia bacterium]